MEESSKKFMNIEYYAKNGITLPMIPQWEMYYNSLAKHIGYQGAALYMELVHFFETVSKLNSAIAVSYTHLKQLGNRAESD